MNNCDGGYGGGQQICWLCQQLFICDETSCCIIDLRVRSLWICSSPLNVITYTHLQRVLSIGSLTLAQSVLIIQVNKMQTIKRRSQLSKQPRKKLHSLRSLTSHDLPATVDMHKRSFDKLEKSLNRDNHLEEQPVAEPVAIIPGFEEEAIEGKLWSYFQGRVEAVGGKVEKEQVNCRQKQFSIIRQQVTHLQRNYNQQAAQLQAVIKEKYKQVHGLFEEIKQERTMKVAVMPPKTKKSKKEPQILDTTERLVTLKEQVHDIRTDVSKLEQQVAKIRQDADKFKREWVTFLQRMLKGGHYLKDGMESVLREMIESEYVPTAEDMPSFLDQSSKKFLLQEYEHLKNGSKRTFKVTPLRLERSRILSEARQSLSQIARKNLVRELYKDTQDFMANLVKMPDWRTTNITLPKIKTSHKSGAEGADWKEYERKRIGFVYAGEDLVKARGVLFGWRAPPAQ